METEKIVNIYPVSVGPVVKGTEHANHIKIWSKIKHLSKHKTHILICRIKLSEEINFSTHNYRYAIPIKDHEYITLFDFPDLEENSVYEYQIGYVKINDVTSNNTDLPLNYSSDHPITNITQNSDEISHIEIDDVKTDDTCVMHINVNWCYASYGTFKTGNINSLCFIFGSCRKWIKILNFEISKLGKSGDKVYNAIRNHNIDLFLSIGDQVYLDPICKNILQCKTFKQIIKRYDKVRSYENIKYLMANTCTYEICDDHDHLCNNSNYKKRHKYRKIYQKSIRAYIYYQGMNGPESYSLLNFANLTNKNSDDKDLIDTIKHTEQLANGPKKSIHLREPLYYSFERENASFFVMDTRNERDERIFINKKIISKKQFSKIESWINDNEYTNKFLFLVSPTPVVSQNTQVSWYGYPLQQSKLIELIVNSNNRNIYILTGDTHCCRFGIYSISSKNGQQSTITEIMSSGLASLNHSHGKMFSDEDNDFDVELYDRDNDFPYIIDNSLEGGIKLVTHYASKTYPERGDKVSKGVFTKITIKEENMHVEIFNQENNLLDSCGFKLV